MKNPLSNSNTMEPFGYFKAEPFGWTDCDEFDEGATALWDREAIDSLSADVATLEQEHRAMRARNERLESEKQSLITLAESAKETILAFGNHDWDCKFVISNFDKPCSCWIQIAINEIDAAIAKVKESEA